MVGGKENQNENRLLTVFACGREGGGGGRGRAIAPVECRCVAAKVTLKVFKAIKQHHNVYLVSA